MFDIVSWLMIFVCVCNIHRHWFFILMLLYLVASNILRIRKALRERNKDLPLVPDSVKVLYTVLMTLQVVMVIILGCTQYNPINRYKEIEHKCEELYGYTGFESVESFMEIVFVFIPDSVTDKFMSEHYDAILKERIIELGDNRFTVESSILQEQLNQIIEYADSTYTKQIEVNFNIITCVYLIALIIFLDSFSEKLRVKAIEKLSNNNIVKEEVNEEVI